MARVDVARLRGNPGGDVKELARGVFAQAPVVPTGVLCLADHGHVVGSFGATTTLATLIPRDAALLKELRKCGRASRGAA